MRPPEFTGGNGRRHQGASRGQPVTSMRPPEFTGGNWTEAPFSFSRAPSDFNEAAGIHRRKRQPGTGQGRPGQPDFNEAAGIHRRKPEQAGGTARRPTGYFNEAAGIHRRKLAGIDQRFARSFRTSMRPPEFTGGNAVGVDVNELDDGYTSMRPPEFTGGNKLCLFGRNPAPARLQ